MSFHRPFFVLLLAGLPMTLLAQPAPPPEAVGKEPRAVQPWRAAPARRMPPAVSPAPRGALPFDLFELPVLRGLDLSESQQDKVFAILHGQAPALREAAKRIRKADMALQEASRAEKFDEAKVRELADAAGKAHGDLAFLDASMYARLLAALTPEQRHQLEEERPGAGLLPPPPGTGPGRF